MAQSSRKDLSRKKRSSPTRKDELVPIRFKLDEAEYAFLDQIAKRSGRSVSEVACMFLEVAVDKNMKIDASVDRAMQHIVAEDIARRFGPLLRLLRLQNTKTNASN